MDSDRTFPGDDKPRVSSLYKSIVGLLILANVIAGVGLVVRALTGDDATSVAANADGVALDNDSDDESVVADDAAMADEDVPDGVAMADDAMADDAMADDVEAAPDVPLESGIDPAIVLDSVEFIASEDGATGAASTIDSGALWTGTDLPTEGLVRTHVVVKPEPLAERGSKYSADWQIHSLTTGELVESTFELFSDGQLPVFELGDRQLPLLVERAMADQPIESDFIAVYPLGMDDLPVTLASGDAYVAFLQIYRYTGPDDEAADDGGADDAGLGDEADASGADADSGDADAGDAADADAGDADADAGDAGADDAGSDDSDDAGPTTDDSDDAGPTTDDSDDSGLTTDDSDAGVEDTEGGN